MCDGCIVDLDALRRAEVLKFFGCEVCPVVGDDVVRHAETEDYRLGEVYSRRSSRVGDRGSFDLLGELVDCHEEVSVATLG